MANDSPSRDTFEIVKSVTGWIAGALLMIVMGVTGAAYSNLSTRLDKQENISMQLQKESITEDKLKDTEARINSNTQRELGFMRSELQSTNRMMEKILEKLDRK